MTSDSKLQGAPHTSHLAAPSSPSSARETAPFPIPQWHAIHKSHGELAKQKLELKTPQNNEMEPNSHWPLHNQIPFLFDKCSIWQWSCQSCNGSLYAIDECPHCCATSLWFSTNLVHRLVASLFRCPTTKATEIFDDSSAVFLSGSVL